MCWGDEGVEGTVRFIYRFTFCVFYASGPSWKSVSLKCHHARTAPFYTSTSWDPQPKERRSEDSGLQS